MSLNIRRRPTPWAETNPAITTEIDITTSYDATVGSVTSVPTPPNRGSAERAPTATPVTRLLWNNRVTSPDV
jgi:hypothetical protein